MSFLGPDFSWIGRSAAELLAHADEAYKRYPTMVRIFENWEKGAVAAREVRLAAGIAELRNASLLVGAAELVVTLGVPIAVWIGVFVALGAPYAEAKALVQNANFQTGFTQGFVTGLLKWEWRRHTVPRFFMFGPAAPNHFDESLSYVAANSYNEGLRAGYVHAMSINDDGKKAILSRLRSLSPSTRPGRWNELDQRDYVIELAGAGRRYNVFRIS